MTPEKLPEKVLDVAPAPSLHDVRDSAMPHAERDSDLAHAFAAGVSRPDVADIPLGETTQVAALSYLDSQRPTPVHHVLLVRDILQILYPVVRLDPVDVVDFHTIRTRADECLGDKAMNSDRPRGGFVAQHKGRVPAPRWAGPQHEPGEVANAARVGHLIRPPGDAPPFFDAKILFHAALLERAVWLWLAEVTTLCRPFSFYLKQRLYALP